MQLPFWKDLTERERETVQRSAVTRRYEKGALIHDGGSECLGLVLVLSGELRTYLLSDEGREVTLFRLYAGDLCVLSASCVISQITFDTQMTAQRDTEVLIIPANIVAMLKGLDRRLAGFLLSEAERTGSDTIRMTHEQIAQHISSAREAVARMLKQFSEEGLVELKRGAITLRDFDSLKQLI